ncbi:MAG: protein kinase [Polyangia bacterium]
MIGRTIGNYVVRDKIGEGGMGVVYLAEHPRIGRKVAIKVLLPQLSQNPEVVSRFFTEARASSAIKNEHIIDIIDFGELPDHSSYITMEWLDGESLASLLERERVLPLARVQHIVRGIGRALTAAHAHGIVHRDLKPDNIFLVTKGDDRDFVKVLDFGIAKLMTDEAGAQGPGGQGSGARTRTGAIIGTPVYMSPEQCRGISVDERSDIYSFGIIVYQMLTGQVPFAAEGLGDLLLKHMTEAPRPLRELAPSLPESVERAVLHALEKEPQQRYARVEQLVAALGVATTGVLSTLPTTLTAPAAVHVSATDTIGAAVGETRAIPPGRSTSWAWIALPLALGGALAAAKLWPSHGDEGGIVGDVAPHAAVRTVAPSTTAVPPPEVREQAVRLDVRATPKEAEIRVDGVVQPNPWSETRVADGAKHDVTISAPGYVPYRAQVTLDRDVTIARELVAIEKPRSEPRSEPKGGEKHMPKHVETTPQVVTHPATPEKKPDTEYRGTKGTLIQDNPFGGTQ